MGTVYCLSVPSTFVLVRAGGDTYVTGQCPKSLELMECFIPDEGCDWIEADWSALEPHVLAELSRDAGLMRLYGPGAKPHDRYLFSLANYPGALGDLVRKHYDCENPTKDSVDAAKKALKGEREIGKVNVLSGDYGAGWRKQQATLRLKGVRLTDAEAQSNNAAHKELHRGVYYEFIPALETEWRRRGGWVYSGLGHPVCVFERFTKDLCNRVIQSTGHNVHVIYIAEYSRRLDAAGIPYLGIVWDFHDQFIVQVAKRDSVQALDIARQTVDFINTELATQVRLKMEPRVVNSLGSAKMEESWQKKYGSASSA